MKKVLFLLMMMAHLPLLAQRFEPQVKVGCDIGIDNDKNMSLGAEFLAGYRFNGNFRLGVGTGISWCEHLYEKAGTNNIIGKHYNDYKESAAYVPLFVNSKLNFIKQGISPYLSFDFGYSFFIAFSDYAKDNKLGIMARPALGVDFPIGDGRLFAEVGYKYQKRNWRLMDNANYSQISFALGYSF